MTLTKETARARLHPLALAPALFALVGATQGCSQKLTSGGPDAGLDQADGGSFDPSDGGPPVGGNDGAPMSRPDGGGGPPPTAPGEYLVGGAVVGLSGGRLVLSNNGDDEISLSSDGAFYFPTVLSDGDAYNIEVASDPATDHCVVERGLGNIDGAHALGAAVVCKQAPDLVLTPGIHSLTFTWTGRDWPTRYRLFRLLDGQPAEPLGESTTEVTFTETVAAHWVDWATTRYFVQACNPEGCARSRAIRVSSAMLETIAYAKAKEPVDLAELGYSTALSSDGKVLVVGARRENLTGASEEDEAGSPTADNSGAAYVFGSMEHSGTKRLDWFPMTSKLGISSAAVWPSAEMGT